MWPLDQEFQTGRLRPRERLAEHAFAAAWAEGQALSVDVAMALALAGLDEMAAAGTTVRVDARRLGVG